MASEEKKEAITVCVTGATGFIASHLVEQLLHAGYTVHGTVRSLAAQDKYSHLSALPGAAERLKFFEASLSQPGAFDDAVAGCQYVMHVASPYTMNAENPLKELVEPAVQGSENLLASVKKVGGVKRVILTSSVAAITDSPNPEHVYTEADWNTESNLQRNPYYYSKKLAEEAAWKYSKENNIDLVVINPFVVMGPSMTKEVNPSNAIVRDIFCGQYPAIMSLTWGIVDVRDVARAHILAMEPNANGRNLCCNVAITMEEMVKLLKEKYPDYSFPSFNLNCAVGSAIVKAASFFQPGQVGQYLRTNLSRPVKFDNSKSKNILGLQYHDWQQTVLDTAQDLFKWGHLKEKQKK